MIRGIILDLDGTVYLGATEVPGAGGFVRRCHAAGIACLFATNRSNRLPAEVAAQIRGYGVECADTDVLTVSQATAAFLPPGAAFIIGEEGLEIPLREAGFTITDRDPDYVIVGFDRGFNYQKLKTACTLIHQGARFIATNPDQGLRLEDHVSPGTGALVAAVAAGSGRPPFYIGKPERRFMDMAVRRLGLPHDQVIVVGDNLDTDIRAGQAAGLRTALLLTGITGRADLAGADIEPTWVVESYAELEALVFAP